MIISLVLTLVVWFQSCAALVGGSLGEEFGQTARERSEAKELSDASGFGLVAGILWVAGAGLVLASPRMARWFYAVASLLLLGARAGGYDDAYVWAVASVIFSLWLGAGSARGSGSRRRQSEPR